MHHPFMRHALFGLINFALTAPGIYLWIGLPLVMRQHGWSGTEIGIFQLAGLPAVFKLFLALPVQNWQLGRRPQVYWAWLTGGGYFAALLALAALNAEASKAALFALTLGASLFSTWADIPVNALAIRLFPPAERPLAGSIRSAVTFAGAIVGGGAMLLVEQAFGWAAPFFVLAGCLLLALALLGLVHEGDGTPTAEGVGPVADWGGFFRRRGAKMWVILLATYYPPVAVAWIYLKPLLLDHGFPAGEVAWIAGIGGSVLGALASLATGLLPRRRLAAASAACGGPAPVGSGQYPGRCLAGICCCPGISGVAACGCCATSLGDGRSFCAGLHPDYGVRAQWTAGLRLRLAIQHFHAGAHCRCRIGGPAT